jgi:hypothetical protein
MPMADARAGKIFSEDKPRNSQEKVLTDDVFSGFTSTDINFAKHKIESPKSNRFFSLLNGLL